MGWLDKTKVWLGIVDAEDVEDEDDGDAPRAALRVNPRNREDRPPLDGIEAAPQQTLEDVLRARDAGDVAEMRRLLREMDRGQGLRLVLRAAAALEAGDDAELLELLPRVRREEPPWRLPLQIAAALEDHSGASKLRDKAAQLGAPRWALAWCEAMSSDAETQRRGLVELLFCDLALARTVGARDLGIPGAEADVAAAKRYAGFAHGRDCIRRFGAKLVADVLAKASLS